MPEIKNQIQQDLSSLMDGELDPARLDALLDELHENPRLLDDWQRWHCAADRLRGEPAISMGFLAGVSSRLAAEPSILAPRRIRKPLMRRVLAPLTIAASISFVLVSAWQTYGPAYDDVIVADMKPENEPAARAYLAAHREDADNALAEGNIVVVAFEPGKNR